MPPQLQALMQNRNAMIGAGVALLLIIVLIIFIPRGNSGGEGSKKISKEHYQLSEVDSKGKALEIQALLAREGIRLNLEPGDGGKVKMMFEKNITLDTRDQAIITLVSSGLMDKNVGLESFDKGDLTASREEKRIKLVRAQQGELARLIRRIEGVESASVNLSIPEASLFRGDEKPVSATVQVQLPTGEQLDRTKIRAIINLVAGSVSGLEASRVSLTDTHGNIYNSILNLGAELNDKLQEQDQYMKGKVSSQLDKLVGSGDYVVSVSTLLREASREMLVQEYSPNKNAVSSEQNFRETLRSSSEEGEAGGATSSFVPKSVATATGGDNSSKRGYNRVGSEVRYENTKKQWVETSLPGMIEDISIAVTINKDSYPSGMSKMELKQLIANAASPKVNADSVTIASADFNRSSPNPLTGGGKSGGLAGFGDTGIELGWLPWAAGSIVVVLLLLVLVSALKGKTGSQAKEAHDETQRELQELKNIAVQNQSQLQEAQKQTQRLLEEQERQKHIQTQESPMLSTQGGQGLQPQLAAGQLGNDSELEETLQELKSSMASKEIDDDEFNDKIKNWIES